MKRVSVDDIKKINEVYYQCHSYAETARQTGWSAATVKNYVKPDFKPVATTAIRKFTMNDMPEWSCPPMFEKVKNYGELCKIMDDERVDLFNLWEELPL